MKNYIQSNLTTFLEFISKLKIGKITWGKSYNAKNDTGEGKTVTDDDKDDQKNVGVKEQSFESPINVTPNPESTQTIPNEVKKESKKLLDEIFKNDLNILDIVTIIVGILGLIYFLFRHKIDTQIKNIFQTNFTIEHIWLLLIIIFFINVLMLRILTMYFKLEQKKGKTILETRKVASFVVIGFTIFLFLLTYSGINKVIENNKDKFFPIDTLKHEGINLLVTKFKPIITQSYFDKNYTDIDLSNTVYQQMLSIRGFHDSLFEIGHYEHCLNFNYKIVSCNDKKYGDFNLIDQQTKWDAILTGEILEEGNKYQINNCLYLLSDKFNSVIKKWNEIQNGNEKINTNIIKYYSNPIDYYKKLMEKYFIKNDTLGFFAFTNFEFNYNNVLQFPSNLSFNSSMEKSPYIILYFLEVLNNWGLYENKRDIEILNKNIRLLDKIIFRFPLSDSKDSKKSELEINFMTQIYSLKAYFINELIINGNYKNNYQLYFEKTTSILTAAKYLYELKGYSEDEIKVFEFLFLYSSHLSILSCKEINKMDKSYEDYSSYYHTIYATKLTLLIESIKGNELLKVHLTNLLNEI